MALAGGAGWRRTRSGPVRCRRGRVGRSPAAGLSARPQGRIPDPLDFQRAWVAAEIAGELPYDFVDSGEVGRPQ